jgi:NitT/TauT family transport system substrate-binding protein
VRAPGGRKGDRRLVPAIAVIIVAALVAAACGGSDDGGSATPTAAPGTTAAGPSASGGGEGPGTPAPRPLPERTSATIAVAFPVEPFAAVYLAQEMGEFEAENLDVEIVQMPANEGIVALASGQIEMQLAGISAGALNAIAGGTDLVFVANGHYLDEAHQDGLWVRKDLLGPDGEIDPARIPGMRISLGSAGVSTTSAVPVARWLDEHGYGLGDITSVPLGGPDMLVALEQGSVDASYLNSPMWQQPSVAECCVLVTPQPPIAASVYTFTAEGIEREPEVAAAIMRAIARTVRTYLQGDYHADPEVMAVLSEVLGTPIDVLASSPSLRFDPDLGLEVDVLEESQAVWVEAGGILEYDEPRPLDAVADTSLVEAVLAGG